MRISRQLLFYRRNREELLPLRREYARLHKKEKSEYDKNYRLLNKEKIDRRIEKHREDRQIYARDYRKTHKSKLAEYKRIRTKSDPQYRIANILRSRLKTALRNNQKTGSAVRDLGCSIDEFKIYLEKQFVSGMSWDKLGQIHIDHKVPLSFFDLTDREQLLKAVHYTNLQPLWAIDNYKKGNKILV